MKKILFLLHLPPPVHGSSIVGRNIYNSKVINEKIKASYINLSLSNSISKVKSVNILKIFNSFLILIKTFYSIIFNRPDLCYMALTVSGLAFFRDVMIISLLKIFRIKIVYHMHNKGVANYQNRFIYNILYRYVFNNVDVILLSNRLYCDIEKYIKSYRIHICPNGLSDNAKKYKKSLKTPNSPVKLLFLSNLIKSKGVYVLLDACKILDGKGYDFHCYFVGNEGDIDRSTFELALQKINFKNKVLYLGPMYDKNKDKIMLESDIFIFPTYYSMETFGLVNIEAMQFSTPVISTNEGGILDIIDDGENGFIVQQKDPIDLASKIEVLMNDNKLRLRMGKKARIKYEQNFTKEIFEHNMLNILLNL